MKKCLSFIFVLVLAFQFAGPVEKASAQRSYSRRNDAQLANIDLQNNLRRQQQTQSTISNTSKWLHSKSKSAYNSARNGYNKAKNYWYGR